MIESTDEVRRKTRAVSYSPEFHHLLADLVGKVVTVVDPEEYVESVVGHSLTTGFRKAKVLYVGTDYLVIASEFVHRQGQQGTEVHRECIPISRIKRLGLMSTERVLHL